ncbi:MAG: aldo/keto reductase, partial [Candidatus Eremiobacteraeota bacterium]|nr:aldo/keto reductase [Candidatus Eremiobacteraeota bacterium]
ATIVSVQNRYNAMYRDSEQVLKNCERDGIVFIPWFPLEAGDIPQMRVLNEIAQEKNVTPHQIAIAWLLERSPMVLPIPGTSSLAHLEENVAAAAITLTQDDCNRIATAAEA